GDNYQGSIASGISSADLFIPLFSNNSLNSNTDKLVNVKGEWAQASNTNVKTSGKIKGKEKPALMLLAIEKIDKAHPVILEYFGKRSVENAFGGIVSDELIKQVKEKLNIL
ncbi:MAG: hypothetical protein JWQ96_2807, partial [Segetibacter sp.]|nr:hypothetical protein [Segetibacter sp.]